MAVSGRLKIVIPGGTGRLGQILARHLLDLQHEVTIIGRHTGTAPCRCVHWNGCDSGEWMDALNGADIVVNLVGRSTRCRQNKIQQAEIRDSRISAVILLGNAIAGCSRPPALWLNASCCSMYPNASHRVYDESETNLGCKQERVPSKWIFLAESALETERVLFSAATPRTRRIAMRTAPVMTPDCGSVFADFLMLVRLGLGGNVGGGNQYVSWVHHIDFIRAIEFLIAHERIEGPVNITSPVPITNSYFMRCLRHAWCTGQIGLPTPRWAVSVAATLLNRETELVLKSRRVVPSVLLKSGFQFDFPNWRGASQDLLCRWRNCNCEDVLAAATV